MSIIRVLIVDDVVQVREDLRRLLNLEEEIKIVGEAENGLEAARLVFAIQPEVILMDLEMPVLDGYAATRLIKDLFPASRVIALTAHDDKAARERAARAGVDVFLVKGVPVEVLLNAIF